MKVHKKNPGLMAGGMATMLLCTLLFSCNKEDFPENGNTEKACDNICFGISSDKDIQTRGYAGSNDEGYTADRFVLRSDNSADTLCVRAIVSDGINVSGFEGEQTLTRGTPVDGTNFYNQFHVLAYWKKNGTLVDNQFYMDEEATNNGSIWSTERIYYWPGAEHSFQFYAWAPTDAAGLTPPSTPQSKVLTYTVPAEATAQKDIVVATTSEIPGDNNEAVSLTFKHICTAVRFVVGSQMQQGTIKSVALKGVNGSGAYDMSTEQWTLTAEGQPADFLQTLDKATTGTETEGTEITSAEGTFMMLPQTLPANATVEVVFTNSSGQDRTLSASIAGMKWPMGKTVTYKLTITPEYELEFISEPIEQDAHYLMYPIKVSASKLQGKEWTVSVDGTPDWVDLKWESDLINLERQGFWIDNTDQYYTAKRSATITQTADGEFILYAFLKENISGQDRTATLSVKVGGQVIHQFKITQKSAISTGSKYVELFDNRVPDGTNLTDDTKPVPWGFAWSASDNEHYIYVPVHGGGDGTKIPPGWHDKLIAALTSLGISYTHDPNEKNKTVLIPERNGSGVDIYINMASFTNIGSIAQSEDDGLTNTWQVYTMDGIGDLGKITQLMNIFPNVQPANESMVDVFNPTEFAAYSALKKNMFNLKASTEENPDGGTLTVLEPVIKEEDVKWYLPAVEEYDGFSGSITGYPLDGIYWTSTASSDGSDMTKAYIYPGSTLEDRGTEHKIRAIRVGN